MVVSNVLKIVLREPTTRINHRRIASLCKLVFLVKMTDSRLQISPRRPEKNHMPWYGAYILGYALFSYSRGGLQAFGGMEWPLDILSHCKIETY